MESQRKVVLGSGAVPGVGVSQRESWRQASLRPPWQAGWTWSWSELRLWGIPKASNGGAWSCSWRWLGLKVSETSFIMMGAVARVGMSHAVFQGQTKLGLP